MSCPFVSADVLARIPADKRVELEKYYKDMMSNNSITPSDMS